VEIDASRYPVVVLRWFGPVSDADVERVIREFDKLAQRAVDEKRHYAVVTLGDGQLTATQRRRLASWSMLPNEGRSRWLVGTYVVLHGAFARGTFTAMKWLMSNVMAGTHLHPDDESALAAAELGVRRASTANAS
jgi:hypothetical protein